MEGLYLSVNVLQSIVGKIEGPEFGEPLGQVLMPDMSRPTIDLRELGMPHFKDLHAWKVGEVS